MILIAHRGNTSGPNKEQENKPEYIDKALEKYDCEIDVWKVGDYYFLGHDKPEHKVDYNWFRERQEKLWIHCKDISSFTDLHTEFNCFYHNIDHYTLTSHNYIWAYPGFLVYEKAKAIAVMPEKTLHAWNLKLFAGICSDLVEDYD